MLILEQVDSIVRRIEDEKSSQEQREKTRDAIARIDGLDNDRVSCSESSYRSRKPTSSPCLATGGTQTLSYSCKGTQIRPSVPYPNKP
jgi:hypothetical protein